VFLGGHECFDLLLEVVGQEGVLSSDIRGNSPMHYAVSFNKLELFPKLMAAGADLDVRNKEGRSLFLQAVLAGQSQVCTMLMQRNRNVMQDVDANGCTGLHLLCKDLIPGSEGMFHAMSLYLLSNGINPHALDKHNCTALHYAAATGYAPLVSSIAWKMLKTLAFQEDSSVAAAAVASASSSSSSSTQEGSEGGGGGGLMAFASVCGIAPDLDLKEVVSGGGGGGGAGLVGSPLFFACHNRRTDIVRLLLRGIQRPHLVHPLMKVVTPGPGGTCDASGLLLCLFLCVHVCMLT
jgi:ankyrin repeat protein